MWLMGLLLNKHITYSDNGNSNDAVLLTRVQVMEQCMRFIAAGCNNEGSTKHGVPRSTSWDFPTSFVGRGMLRCHQNTS